MKTSNIIILSTIGILISLNLWMAVDAKNKFENYTKHNTAIHVDNKVTESSLGDFSHIIVSQSIHLNIETSTKNTISDSGKEQYQSTIINDTLYISGDAFISIKCKSIKSIVLKGESKLNTEDLFSEYLLIKSFDDTRISLNNISLTKLDIYSTNDSRIIMTQSKIDTTNILSTENSRIGIVGTLEVVRGEVKDNSNLSVTGANNTQFSKSGNASINMH